MRKGLLQEIRKLSVKKRLELIELIEESLPETPLILTASQRAELNRRIAEAKAHPERSIPLKDLVAEMDQRYSRRRRTR
jgi:putative addiction module component (TIGR02574 family)